MLVKKRIGKDRRDRTILWLGSVLFVAAFSLVILATLPGDVIVSAFRTPAKAMGWDLSARDADFTFPLGVRLSGVTLSIPGKPSIELDEIAASWEWTGLFRWAPARLRLRRGDASADLRFSPAFWNPGSGSLLLSGISSSDLPLSVFSASGAGFSIRQVEARWDMTRGKLTGAGSGTLTFLQVPVPAPDSPIREARIEGVSLSFLIRENAFRIPKLAGTFEGSQVDGTGEVTQLLSPEKSMMTFHLRIRNPFDGRVASLFDMLSKNAKNATLRIVGTVSAPKGEFQFF